MTAIQHSLMTGQSSQRRADGAVTQASKVAVSSGAETVDSSIVNISWQAVMRLSAYNQQRDMQQKTLDGAYRQADNSKVGQIESERMELDSKLPENIKGMLLEIEQNLVQTTEPGYRYLRHLLNNQSEALTENSRLEELVRKEKFFLGRRRAFMDSSEFQSYSQVLSQFSNIIQREFSGE